MSWLLAAAWSAGIVSAAFAARALTASGAAAAWLVGTLVLGALGWPGGLVLLAFFISASLVGRLVGRPQPMDAKGERRDWAQVAANGTAAVIGACIGLVEPQTGFMLTAVALSAAAADTWATAWGSGSAAAPRHILTGRVVPPGTSGGISLRGTLGGAAGAVVVGLAAATGPEAGIRVPMLVMTLGTLGMLLDSVLGAALQGRFRCPVCDMASERRQHRCGTPTDQVGGIRWIDNDVVNALATTLTMGLAWLLHTA